MSDFENTTEVMLSEPSSEDIGAEYFDHIKKINDIFYDQIKISDQKAAYIFTFMLAFLVSSVEVRAVFTWARYAQGTPQAILFSPSHDELPAKDLAAWVLEDRLPVRLQLQAHKYIWGADVRGV